MQKSKLQYFINIAKKSSAHKTDLSELLKLKDDASDYADLCLFEVLN